MRVRIGSEWVDYIKGVTAFLLVVSTGFAAWFVRIRTRNQLSAGHEEQLHALREEQEQLRAEIEGRIGELEERLAFTERQLLAERERKSIAPPSRINTPV